MKKTEIRRTNIIRYIGAFTAEHQYPPSIRDLADKFGVSTGTIFRDLESLEESGDIVRHKGMARTVRIV